MVGLRLSALHILYMNMAFYYEIGSEAGLVDRRDVSYASSYHIVFTAVLGVFPRLAIARSDALAVAAVVKSTGINSLSSCCLSFLFSYASCLHLTYLLKSGLLTRNGGFPVCEPDQKRWHFT